MVVQVGKHGRINYVYGVWSQDNAGYIVQYFPTGNWVVHEILEESNGPGEEPDGPGENLEESDGPSVAGEEL